MKKVISLLLSILMIITTVVPLTASAQSYTEKLVSQGFPRDYAEKLNELHNKYPYWIFKLRRLDTVPVEGGTINLSILDFKILCKEFYFSVCDGYKSIHIGF